MLMSLQNLHLHFVFCVLHFQIVKEQTLMKHFFCSPNPHIFGGGERDRTDGLLRARQALSQLSYTPSCSPLDKNGGPGWI
jgi:hypothetical protein